MTQEKALHLHDHPDKELWALVPVKSLARTKQRLKASLGNDRPGLTQAMLKDVLNALVRSREITRIAVVTDDPRVSGIAESRGAQVVDEVEAKGMIEALELGIAAIRRWGGRRLVIFPADIPLVTGPEIDRVVQELQIQRQTHGNRITGIGPSKDRGGTNFLCIDTSHPLPLMYGPGSYERHRQCAIEHGSRPVSLHSSAVALDIDEKKDLEEFISHCLSNPEFQETRTWQFLKEKGYINHAGQTETVHGNEKSVC